MFLWIYIPYGKKLYCKVFLWIYIPYGKIGGLHRCFYGCIFPTGKCFIIRYFFGCLFPCGKKELGAFLRRRYITIEKNAGCDDSPLGDE